jgi:SNF2 family DNA or RNA helicase
VNYYQFRNRYCILGGHMGKKVVAPRNVEELNANLQTCGFIARKKDYADLPGKIYMPLRKVEMAKEQAAAYREMEKQLFTDIAATSTRVAVQQVITRDLKMRQILSGYITDENGHVHWLVEPKSNGRVKAIKEIVDDEIEGKLCVVVMFKPTMDMLMTALADYKPAIIRGGMSTEQIAAAKNSFNADPSCRIILLQEQAAKYGHTLLGHEGHECSDMAFYEQSYSLDDRSQIEDRINRYGQKFTCRYHDLFAAPLDRATVAALQRKEDVAAAIMGYGRETGLLPPKWAVSGDATPDYARVDQGAC